MTAVHRKPPTLTYLLYRGEAVVALEALAAHGPTAL